jgi:hypothetical protein
MTTPQQISVSPPPLPVEMRVSIDALPKLEKVGGKPQRPERVPAPRTGVKTTHSGSIVLVR